MMRSSLFFLFCLSLNLTAGDWLQFRGGNGAATADDVQLPVKLEPRHVAWKMKLPGRGLSSPLVIGDRLYLTACSGLGQERLHVICLSARDGGKLWERQFWATGRTMAHEKISVAANTPCSDGRHIFAFFSSNDLICLDLDGHVKWLRGITRDYPNASNSLGMAASPIVTGDTLIVPVENDSESFTLGVDVATGVNRWKMERPKLASWTSPVVVPDAATGRTLVVLQAGPGLSAVDPVNGKEAWYYAEGASTMASSVLADGVLYVPSRGITALKPGAAGQPPEVLWQNNQLSPATASPVVVGGRVFTVNAAGILTCGNGVDGVRLWQLRTKGPYSATPLAVGPHLYLVNEKGLVQVVNLAAPEGEVVGTLDLEDTIIGTPSIGAGALFIRSDKALYKISGT